MISSPDVLVVGAGPVGLTLACELLRHGSRVRLVEKNAQLCQHPNAAIVHVRSLEILAAMGAVDGFLREGHPIPGMHVHAFGKKIGYVAIGGLDSPYPCPRTLGQQITVRLLHEHFQRLGGEVEMETEALGFEQDADGVRVRLRHAHEAGREEIAQAKYVVGCEGSASIIRQTLAIDFPGERYPGKEFLQADCFVRWTYPHGFGYQFVTDDYILMFFAYDFAGHYRIICARNDQDPKNDAPPSLEEMQTLVRELADPGAELYDPVWFNRFRSGHRLAATFREGRAFLAGDAGHVHIPIGGQGMNYGMHDAFNLGWKLAAVARREAKPELLDSYMAERHSTDATLIHATDRAYHLMIEPHAMKKIILKWAGPALMSFEPVQKQIRDTLAEMRVCYPDSPLTEDHGGSAGPAPGERAPDALLVRLPSRETARLHEVLRDPRWNLLLFAGPQPEPSQIETLEKISGSLAKRYEPRLALHLVLCELPPQNNVTSVLMDREHYVHDKYGVTSLPCLYLIRPDGYVGFRGSPDKIRELTAYLQRVFV